MRSEYIRIEQKFQRSCGFCDRITGLRCSVPYKTSQGVVPIAICETCFNKYMDDIYSGNILKHFSALTLLNNRIEVVQK